MGRRLLFASMMVLSGLLAAPAETKAQAYVGAQGLYALATGGAGQDSWGVGGRAGVGIGRFPVEIQGVFDYHFPSCPRGFEDCSSWAGVVNVLFKSREAGPFYIGGGVIYQDREYPSTDPEVEDESATSWGFNGTAGLQFDFPVLNPFVEFRYELYSDIVDRFVISAGLVVGRL